MISHVHATVNDILVYTAGIVSATTLFTSRDNPNAHIDIWNTVSSIQTYGDSSQLIQLVQRRSLKEEGVTLKPRTPWESTKQLLQLVALTAVPLNMVHSGLYYISHKWSLKPAEYMNGILGVPGFQLLTCVLLMNPFMKCAADLAATKELGEIIGGVALCVVLPVPLIGLGCYVVTKYVRGGVITYNCAQHKSVLSVIKTNLYGRWSSETIDNRYGIFYEHIRGFHPQRSRFVNGLRIYHVPIKFVKNFAITFAMSCIVATARKVAFALTLSAAYFSMIYFMKPLNGFRQQQCESYMELCDVTSYILVLAATQMITTKEAASEGIGVTDKTKLSLLIINQSWALTFMLWHYVAAKIAEWRRKHTSGKMLATSKQDAANNVKTEVVENGDDIGSDSYVNVFD